ncbi:copper amine oxidase N-terminal domain-containing protein [Rummeliibacillus pycnus]|uniref:copper amine oxidase N-terminal domain-containing protein n=1 Tax=Rummeliibacillus pycnus TaxID=101070 RepID=UPI000C9B5638|nr:copper amine oxidase N-terminal domain-containing protein [Rummeliibacillus pycnus]
MKRSNKWILLGIVTGTLLIIGFQKTDLIKHNQSSSGARQPHITMVSNTKVTYYKTTYNGKAIATKTNSISVSGKYLVSANEVLKKAGATVSYNSKTKTFTIKAGSKTTTHKKGTNYAYVNKKKTTLSTKSMVHKGITMVPYDLVSKATTSKVTVSSATKTIKITKSVTSTPTSQTTPKLLYQGHDYGARNNVEYIKTIDYVNKYIADHAKDGLPFGGDYHKSYEAYFKDGVKAPSDMNYNMSDYQYGLYFAELWGKDFRDNKVPYNTIVKLDEVGRLAQNILSDANYRVTHKDKSVRSAYDVFYRHVGDCDATAHVQQVIFDEYGFTTKVAYFPSHADLHVKVGNHWYAFNSGVFRSQD